MCTRVPGAGALPGGLCDRPVGPLLPRGGGRATEGDRAAEAGSAEARKAAGHRHTAPPTHRGPAVVDCGAVQPGRRARLEAAQPEAGLRGGAFDGASGPAGCWLGSRWAAAGRLLSRRDRRNRHCSIGLPFCNWCCSSGALGHCSSGAAVGQQWGSSGAGAPGQMSWRGLWRRRRPLRPLRHKSLQAHDGQAHRPPVEAAAASAVCWPISSRRSQQRRRGHGCIIPEPTA
jgi:hypothetical protein